MTGREFEKKKLSLQKSVELPARNKIAFVLIFAYALLLWHDIIPHHHSIGTEGCVSVNPDNHNDNDHIHFFTGFHTTHPASSKSEITHYQYQQSRPVSQIVLIAAILPEKPEFSPPELLQKPLRTDQSVIPIIEGITLSCGLRAPPKA
jgi:Ca2+/H+ antiporter